MCWARISAEVKARSNCEPVRLEPPSGLLGLLDACRREIGIAPAGEQVLEVPLALAMAQQDQQTFVGSHLSFTVFEDSQARSEARASGGANRKTDRDHSNWR